PFSFHFYGQPYSSFNFVANDNLPFVSIYYLFLHDALPIYTALPYWDDLVTNNGSNCASYPSGCGIFTSVSGAAPNRVFNIEWRAAYFGGTGSANFEVRLYEGQPSRFDFVYGTLTHGGAGAT